MVSKTTMNIVIGILIFFIGVFFTIGLLGSMSDSNHYSSSNAVPVSSVATEDTSSSVQGTQTSQVVSDDEALVNHIKYYAPILQRDQSDASVAITPWVIDYFKTKGDIDYSKFTSDDYTRLFSGLTESMTYYQKLEDDTNSAIKSNTFTNLSPYYKDVNEEWLECLKEYKTRVATIKRVASMEQGGFPINRDGWVSTIENLDSTTQRVERVNRLINGL